MTAVVLTPDLQRIVEALKACRERYLIVAPAKRGLDFGVRDLFSGMVAFSGTLPECQAYIDARCAEAMVRAIRTPSTEMEVVGTEQWLCEAAMEDRSGANWRAMCDAILGETQPEVRFAGNWSYNNTSLTGVQVSPPGGARQEPETAENREASTAQGGALPGSPAPISETQP